MKENFIDKESEILKSLEKELLSSDFPYAIFISTNELSKNDRNIWSDIEEGNLPTIEQFEEYKEKALKNNPSGSTAYFVDYLSNKLTPYFLKEQYKNLKKAS
jgi:hypothetical protein